MLNMRTTFILQHFFPQREISELKYVLAWKLRFPRRLISGVITVSFPKWPLSKKLGYIPVLFGFIPQASVYLSVEAIGSAFVFKHQLKVTTKKTNEPQCGCWSLCCPCGWCCMACLLWWCSMAVVLLWWCDLAISCLVE